MTAYAARRSMSNSPRWRSPRSGVDPSWRDAERPCCVQARCERSTGKFCTVLTTDLGQPLHARADQERSSSRTIGQSCAPSSCRWTKTGSSNPDTSRGWTRVLESVSGDPTQWEMRTALRYWKGCRDTTDRDGIYINYDLDETARVGDGKLSRSTPATSGSRRIDPGRCRSVVRIRTSKQVRIRGVSLRRPRSRVRLRLG